MRAIVIDGFGGPDALRLADIPKPSPGPGEVLVRVAYAGVNPADWKTRRGMLSGYFVYRFPFVLGFDLAGFVEAVGPDVAGVDLGDRVFGMSQQGLGVNGAYAEYVTARPAMLAAASDRIGLAEAAGLPTAGTTAFGGLIDVGGLTAGQTVLVNGGAGGVGSLAVQIARARGASVAATCSAGNAEYVQNLGADVTIDYRNGAVAARLRSWAPDGVDLVLDAVGGGSLIAQAADVVKTGGRYVEIETLQSRASEEQVAAAAASGVQIVSNMVAIARLPEHLAGLSQLVAAGEVKPPATQIMPLAETAAAHVMVEAGHVRGKIVLAVTEAG
jgi:NADPH:quinone reductase-like Zn-dependent oxidoreductase